MSTSCLYCSFTKEEAWIASDAALAVLHPQPIAKFHFVIAPTRHVPTFYDLDVGEQSAIWGIVREIQKRLADAIEMTGVDIGFEDGVSEQDHTHVHVVPRTKGSTAALPLGPEWVFSAS